MKPSATWILIAVFLVHFLCTIWGYQSALLFPPAYAYMNSLILLFGALAIVFRDSPESVLLFGITMVGSILPDIIFFGFYTSRNTVNIYQDWTNEKWFSFTFALINIILKLPSTYVLLRVFIYRQTGEPFSLAWTPVNLIEVFSNVGEQSESGARTGAGVGAGPNASAARSEPNPFSPNYPHSQYPSEGVYAAVTQGYPGQPKSPAGGVGSTYASGAYGQSGGNVQGEPRLQLGGQGYQSSALEPGDTPKHTREEYEDLSKSGIPRAGVPGAGELTPGTQGIGTRSYVA